MNKEIMNESELHEYGIGVIMSYLKNNDFTIIETNTSLDTSPQIIAQKGSDMAFILVNTYMYPKKDAKIDADTIELMKQTGAGYGAKLYIAKVGLAYAGAKNGKELGTPYKNADFLVKFNGFEEA